jgi:hypothetical protein
MILGDFHTQFSPVDRSSRHKKINKETSDVNVTIGQLNITDIYKIFHPRVTEYTFFLAAHRTFSKIDSILGHKASLSKYMNIEITSYILSDNNGIKLEMNSKRSCEKYTNT